MLTALAKLLLGAALIIVIAASATAKPLGNAKRAAEHRVTQTVPRAGTRREILARILAGSGIVVEWRNKAFANEPISGHFDGPIEEAASRVLARGNFIIAYDMAGAKPRVTRILVLGRGSSRAKLVDLRTKFAGGQRAINPRLYRGPRHRRSLLRTRR